ncbi:MAG: hypothetical protein LKF09_12600 [Lachnospiraceae bacterium]|nr:hypothetical protein [Lachnospiraceae bacterium]MCI1303169.1 hypothetical protein [Lachnospiraceae bacterium]
MQNGEKYKVKRCVDIGLTALKYPLKQKWMPAKTQSHTYPRRYYPPGLTTSAPAALCASVKTVVQ